MPPAGRRRTSKIASTQFAAVVHAFLASPKFLDYAPATKDLWGRQLLLAARQDLLGPVSTDEIRPSLVQGFLDGLNHKPAKQMAALAALKQLERWAIVRDLLAFPITLGCEVKRSEGGHEPWTDAQVSLAEQHCRPDLARVITLAVNTGQRGSDLVKMRWSDLETYQGRAGINVIQKKTKKRLWIPMTQELSAIIGTWQKRPSFILLKTDNTPFDRAHISDMWTRERSTNLALEPLKRAGLVLHGLRASAVVRLRRAAATEQQIADMVGMSVEMVRRYCRLSDQRENAMAAVVHLDRTRDERGTEIPKNG